LRGAVRRRRAVRGRHDGVRRRRLQRPSRRRTETFHGTDCSEETFSKFREWLEPRKPVVFVSDNPAYDFQWVNFYFWRYFGENPFGHSGRRIADFYAGLVGDFRSTQKWKRLRRTKHDHHPVHDALGNAEALIRMLDGER
jgi:hypothetical protein